MKKALSRLFAVVATLCLFTACGNKAEDPFVAIGGEDLSQTVICPRQVLLKELDRDVDGLITCDTEYYVQLPEPLGYRGAEYWRFYIHFDTVYKAGDYCYAVEGLTRFRDTVRRFTGEVVVDSLRTIWNLDSLDDYTYRSMRYLNIDAGGYLYGHYLFREDSTVAGSGVLQGKVTYSVVRQRGKLQYDTEGIDYADGFDNNQYEGSWTSYVGVRSEKCNWGDSRIPDSQVLDIGAAYFCPADDYLDKGWRLLRELDELNYGDSKEDSLIALYQADADWWRR